MGFVDKTPEGRWRAYFRDPAGKQRSKTFRTKKAAVFLAEIETSKTRGNYVSPHAGQMRFADHAAQWMDTWNTEITTAARDARRGADAVSDGALGLSGRTLHRSCWACFMATHRRRRLIGGEVSDSDASTVTYGLASDVLTARVSRAPARRSARWPAGRSTRSAC
jgi:hypothetical protein